MKYTQFGLFLGLFFFLGVEKVMAWTLIDPNIKIVTLAPTATPTPVIIKKIDPSDLNFKLVSTVTPTATLTPTPVVVTKVITQTVTQAPSVEPSVAVTQTEEKTENKVDLNKWFMGITIGLLALIMVIQFWPGKKKDQTV